MDGPYLDGFLYKFVICTYVQLSLFMGYPDLDIYRSRPYTVAYLLWNCPKNIKFSIDFA